MKFLNADERKAKAIDIMQKIRMDKSYIDDFDKGTIYCFNTNSVVRLGKTSALYQKVQDVEKKYNCTVFAVTHENFSFGECYSFLLVSDEPELSPFIVTGDNVSIQFAYVWNLDHDHFCEFGSVGILSYNGKICRIR